MIWPKRPPLAFSVAETSVAEMSVAEMSVAEMSYIQITKEMFNLIDLIKIFLSLHGI